MRATERVRNDDLHQEYLILGFFCEIVKGAHWGPSMIREHFRYMWE